MRRWIALLSMAACLAPLSACGTTAILTTDPTARIIVDGETIGRGQAQLRQRGLPFSAQIVVRADDGREKRTSVNRSFTGITLLLGFISYGVCWVACWEYPNVVFVDLPGGANPYAPQTTNPASPSVDPWLAPPPGWELKKETSKTEQLNTVVQKSPSSAPRRGVAAPLNQD